MKFAFKELVCPIHLTKKVSDWVRVKREATRDAPIAHRASDGPDDPNDVAATSAYWKEATIRRGPGRPALAVKRPTFGSMSNAYKT